jgi:succinoglycan biosynthesis protein ExoM
MIQDGPIDITFLICTFHREDLLVEAMRSMLLLEGLGEIRHEILVVDNSDEESARSAVAEFVAATSATHVRYVVAHPPNIAVARNAGVDNAKGRFIAMIDDDMTVRPGWLQAMLPLLREGGFDILCGPVEAIFENPALATNESRKFFHREAPLAKGTEVRVMGPRRTRSFVPATSNSVFRKETCFADGTRFDLRYGKSGGEDVDLFCRLERKGRRIAWVSDAWTSELVPARRCSADYLERRSFSGGQIFAATLVRNSRFPLLVAAKVGIVAALQLLASHARALLGRSRSAIDRQALATRRAAIRGKLSWRQMIPIYASEKPGVPSGKG